MKQQVKPSILRCTCCQAEITAPQFHNGYPYGYTCIRKISNQKRNNTKYQPVGYEVLTTDKNTTRLIVRITAHGKSINAVIYVSGDCPTIEKGKMQGYYYQDGILFMSEQRMKDYGLPLAKSVMEKEITEDLPELPVFSSLFK